MGWKGEDREVVGWVQTKEGTCHVGLDGVGEGPFWVGETDMEQLMVEGVGWGKGETAVESDEGDVELEVNGREPEFEVCL